MMALSSEVNVGVLRGGFDLEFVGGLPSAVAITLFCVDPQVTRPNEREGEREGERERERENKKRKKKKK